MGAAESLIELDLRSLAPARRHARIFELWHSLEPGETLRLTNDHDPKPLRYQFEAEEAGKFEWLNERQGPLDWIVRIKRLKK